MMRNPQGEIIVYTGMVDAIKKTVAYEGVGGLYKGIGLNFLKVLPAVAVSWTVYENLKKKIN
jgi:solute carrier family 25 phosphate transporter 23/24/25/41